MFSNTFWFLPFFGMATSQAALLSHTGYSCKNYQVQDRRGAKKQSLIWQSINVRKASLLWYFTCQSVYSTGQGKLPCFWSAIHLDRYIVDKYITMILVSMSKRTSSYSCNYFSMTFDVSIKPPYNAHHSHFNCWFGTIVLALLL